MRGGEGRRTVVPQVLKARSSFYRINLIEYPRAYQAGQISVLLAEENCGGAHHDKAHETGFALREQRPSPSPRSVSPDFGRGCLENETTWPALQPTGVQA